MLYVFNVHMYVLNCIKNFPLNLQEIDNKFLSHIPFMKEIKLMISLMEFLHWLWRKLFHNKYRFPSRTPFR